MKRYIYIFLLSLIFLSALFAYLNRVAIRDWFETGNGPMLPQAEPYLISTLYRSTSTQEAVNEQGISSSIPKEKHLLVPFMTQAPTANWDMPYQEACEEASLLMVAGYYNGRMMAYEPKTADKMILDLIDFEKNLFGFGADITALQAVEVINAYDAFLTAETIPVSNVDDIKRYISQGIPVIVPADGKALGNPNFRNGGPLYHMLVITGYTENSFITNDPGTRKGNDYVYDEDVLMNAIHDWNGGDVPSGKPVAIIIRRK